MLNHVGAYYESKSKGEEFVEGDVICNNEFYHLNKYVESITQPKIINETPQIEQQLKYASEDEQFDYLIIDSNNLKDFVQNISNCHSINCFQYKLTGISLTVLSRMFGVMGLPFYYNETSCYSICKDLWKIPTQMLEKLFVELKLLIAKFSNQKKANMSRNVGKTAQLANNARNQNLFRAFAVGTTKLSSNNNYSTKVKKENFINFPKQLHNNNKLMNIFVPNFKNYSSSSIKTQVLNLVKYEGWSKEDVCSLLCTTKENGGAGLSLEDVQPLFDAGFKGTSIGNIVTNIQRKDVYFAIEQLKQAFPFIVSGDTLQTVVNWVDNLLKTRLIQSWSIEQAREQLCKPVEKGGAGLSNTIEGSLIETVIQYVIGKKHTLDKLNKMDIDLVLAWTESLKIPIQLIFNETISTPDYIIEARKSSKFEYLRGLKNNALKWEELESRIGQNIELPMLGGEGSGFVPKDYNYSRPYLLTKQRFDILKQVAEKKQDGYVFSGPHGVSKSYTMILIAAYAIVNSIPLLYIPKCGLWIDSYFVHKNEQFLIESFLYYNSDILERYQIERLKITTDIMEFLRKLAMNFDSIFKLFDEHNEIFRKNVQHESYFQSFTNWSGKTTGEKIVTIYCGSAHSKFEDFLPGGAISRVIRIIPPNFSEFKVLVQDFGFVNLSNNDLLKIEYATGRIPREVEIFSEQVLSNFTDNQISGFIKERQNEYERRLEKLRNEYTFSQIDRFLNTIHHLFNLAFLSESRIVNVDGPFYDLGILFKNSYNELFPINEAAKRALFNFYVSNYPVETVNGLKSLEVGCFFERLLIRNEYKKRIIHQRFLLIGGSSEIIEYYIKSQSSFDITSLDMAASLSRKRWLKGESILFVPEKEQFPAIDYLIVTYESEKIQVVLKQATISTIKEHYDNDFTKLVKPSYLVGENKISKPISNFSIEESGVKMTSKYTYSLLELIIHSILDNYNNCNPVLMKEQKDTKQNDTKQVCTQQIMLREKIFNYNYKPVIKQKGNKKSPKDKILLERTLNVRRVW